MIKNSYYSHTQFHDSLCITHALLFTLDNSGLMVQCDKCEVWQHCECIGLIQEKLPDHYYCDQCQPENHQLIKTPSGRYEAVIYRTNKITHTHYLPIAQSDYTTPQQRRG